MNIEPKAESVKKTVKMNASRRKMIEEILNRSKTQKTTIEDDDETLTR